MTGDREYIVSGIRRLKGRTFKALLGKGDSGHTVAVAGKANYVWVRVKYGSSLGAPVQALNRNVPPIHGRVVRVKEIDRAGIKGYEVIDFDDTGTPYYHDDTGHGVLPKHGWTHECSQDTEANDPVNLYTRCWAELRVEPTDPCSLYTYVTHGWYLFDTPTWFIGGNSPLFVPPAMGMRYDLVYIDSSGTIGIEQGDIGGFVATIPEPPDYTIPLAAIQFTGTAGCITEAMILDCRVMPNVKYPPGGAVFDDSITPAAVASVNWTGALNYPARQDHWHQGVHSAKKAAGSNLYGDVTFSEGLNILLTQAGQDISIATRTDPTFVTGSFTGYLNIGEDLTVAHNIYAGDGLVGTPSHSFTSDPDTGMYSMAANRLGFATAGVQALEIDASQVLWIGSTKDTNLYRSAANHLKTDDDFVVGADVLHVDAATGFVGFGHAAPSVRLDVQGQQLLVYANVATAGNAFGLNHDVTPVAATAGTFRGVGGFVRSYGASNFTGHLIGFQGGAVNYSTGLISNAYASSFYFYNTAATTIAVARAMDLTIFNDNAAGIISAAAALYINTPYNIGTLVDTYGLYIASQVAGTQTNPPHAIYQAGASDKSYFAGGIGVGITVPLAKVHIDQASTTAAIPVLIVDQADISEEFVRYIGTAAVGVLTQSIVDEGDQASETREGWLKVYVVDEGDQITDQAYYVPIYALA